MDGLTLLLYRRTPALMLIDMNLVLTVDAVSRSNALATKNYFQELVKKARK